MSFFDIFLIGAALSMDAFSVSLSSGMVYVGMTRKDKLLMPLFFGIFQGIMPTLGFFLGYAFESYISRWQGPIALVILGLIGANMIKEGISSDDKQAEPKKLTIPMLFLLAFATSIDAFAVGVSFAASGLAAGFSGGGMNIFTASSLIAATTFVICIAAIFLGGKVQDKLGKKAEILGGIILIAIGIKAML